MNFSFPLRDLDGLGLFGDVAWNGMGSGSKRGSNGMIGWDVG